ncbi:uncharacterized protein [Narcine bancroftii]|uniref:uncharacterized protein n=1 Tax=Narcine bancroftii TaxID=1343680 RepID=UPI003830FED7
MQWFAGIFTVCSLFAEGLSLKCFRCMDTVRDCTQDGTICNSQANELCTSTLITHSFGLKKSSTLVRSCGVCREAASFNSGIFRRSLRSRCCSSHLCNDRRHHVADVSVPNGLHCIGCFNHSSESCAESESVVMCLGTEYYCLYDHSTEIRTGAMVVTKGCASWNMCQLPRASIYGVQTTSDSVCCQGELCNNGNKMPGLKCHSQSQFPKRLDIYCASQSCKSLHILITTDKGSEELFFSGCGTCKGPQSFSSGTFSLLITDFCCHVALCNDQSIAGEPNNTLNGLECYGCRGNTVESCEGSMETVKCMGEQHWCLSASGRTDADQPLALRGCASAAFCSSPEQMRMLAFHPGPDFHCCQSNHCNRRLHETRGNYTAWPLTDSPTAGRRTSDGPIGSQTIGSDLWTGPIGAQTADQDQSEGPIEGKLAGREQAEEPIGVQMADQDQSEGPIEGKVNGREQAEEPIEAQTVGQDQAEGPIRAQTVGRDLTERPIADPTEGRDTGQQRPTTTGPGPGVNTAGSGSYLIRASLFPVCLLFSLGHWLV